MFLRIQTRIIVLTTLITAAFVAILHVHMWQQKEQALALVRERKQEQAVLFQRAVDVLGKSLRTYAYDYSYWDEMLNFVKAPELDQEWAYQNITTSLPTYGAQYAWVYYTDYSLHFAVGLGSDSIQGDLPIPLDSLKLLTQTERFPRIFVRVQKVLLEICGA
ncbi:hypothetical protein EHM69_12975, partial [candidate division KSB1 bacterium]